MGIELGSSVLNKSIFHLVNIEFLYVLCSFRFDNLIYYLDGKLATFLIINIYIYTVYAHSLFV